MELVRAAAPAGLHSHCILPDLSCIVLLAISRLHGCRRAVIMHAGPTQLSKFRASLLLTQSIDELADDRLLRCATSLTGQQEATEQQPGPHASETRNQRVHCWGPGAEEDAGRAQRGQRTSCSGQANVCAKRRRVLACCFEVSLAAVKYAPVHGTRSGDQHTLTRMHMHAPAYRASLGIMLESTYIQPCI